MTTASMEGFNRFGFGKDVSTYLLNESPMVKDVPFDRTGDVRRNRHRSVPTGKQG